LAQVVRSPDSIGKRRAFDELQHERPRRLKPARYDPTCHDRRLFDPVDGCNVRVVERGEHLRFAFEAREAVGIAREFLGQDLQRDIAIELRIARPIHDPHTACPEQAHDLVRSDVHSCGERHNPLRLRVEGPAPRAAWISYGPRRAPTATVMKKITGIIGYEPGVYSSLGARRLEWPHSSQMSQV
jgi:hypothetical protein